MYVVSIHPNIKPENFENHWYYKKDYKVKIVPDLQSLGELLKKHVWCNSLFMEGLRGSSNFLSSGLLVLDFDNGYPIVLAKEDFKEYKHIIGTTRSHQIPKAGRKCDRFRVILFFESSLTDSVQAKQNFYKFVTDYNKQVKKMHAERIKSYCIKTNQNFDSWQAVDIGSSDIARKWIPFKEIVQLQEGNSLTVKRKIEVELRNPSEKNMDAKAKFFAHYPVPLDGTSFTMQCPGCAKEGSDVKGQNLSVRWSEGQYFYRCHKDRNHKIGD